MREKKTCPVEGCIGKMAAAGQPKVCSVIDTILREYMTEKNYAEVISASSCCDGIFLDSASAAANVDKINDESTSFASGDQVVIEGLQSEKGSKLNGKKARIESRASTGRYTCVILDVSPAVTISVKPENLRKAKEDRYVHYGVVESFPSSASDINVTTALRKLGLIYAVIAMMQESISERGKVSGDSISSIVQITRWYSWRKSIHSFTSFRGPIQMSRYLNSFRWSKWLSLELKTPTTKIMMMKMRIAS